MLAGFAGRWIGVFRSDWPKCRTGLALIGRAHVLPSSASGAPRSAHIVRCRVRSCLVRRVADKPYGPAPSPRTGARLSRRPRRHACPRSPPHPRPALVESADPSWRESPRACARRATPASAACAARSRSLTSLPSRSRCSCPCTRCRATRSTRSHCCSPPGSSRRPRRSASMTAMTSGSARRPSTNCPQLVQLAALLMLAVWLADWLLIGDPASKTQAAVIAASSSSPPSLAVAPRARLTNRQLPRERCLFAGDDRSYMRLQTIFQRHELPADLVAHVAIDERRSTAESTSAQRLARCWRSSLGRAPTA